MLALALGFVVYIVEGVVRMIRRGGRLSIGGFVIIVVVSVLALAIVLPGLVALWVAASDIFRVLLGNETEIED